MSVCCKQLFLNCFISLSRRTKSATLDWLRFSGAVLVGAGQVACLLMPLLEGGTKRGYLSGDEENVPPTHLTKEAALKGIDSGVRRDDFKSRI